MADGEQDGPDEHGEPVLSAAALAQAAGFDPQLRESVVLVFDASLVPAEALKRTRRRGTHPFRSIGSLADGVDIVVAVGPGAPTVAVTVEFLHAFGVRQMISVGTAGQLKPNVGPSLRIVERAESDEGTSQHYRADLLAKADLRAADRLTRVLIGLVGPQSAVTLTTDAPFRHTPDRLRSHRARADLVEMECAALFAAAGYLGIDAAALLVVSDVFDQNRWTRCEPAVTQQALHHAVSVATQALAT